MSAPGGVQAYPRGRDLETLLTAAGFSSIPTGIDLSRAVAAGVQAFEHAVGRRMLAETGTRNYDPPTSGRESFLPFGADLWGTPTSVTFNGTALTLNTDYRCFPENADQSGKPFTALRFARVWYAPLNTAHWGAIAVTGKWGYGASIPEDAYEAMLCRAAYLVLPQLTHNLTGGFTSFHEDDVSEDYGGNPLDYLRKQWNDTYNHTVRRYKRVTDYLAPG